MTALHSRETGGWSAQVFEKKMVPAPLLGLSVDSAWETVTIEQSPGIAKATVVLSASRQDGSDELTNK